MTFNANSDKSSIVGTLLPSLVLVRQVRVKPVSWQDAISLRLELYIHGIGGPTIAPQGSLHPPAVALSGV